MFVLGLVARVIAFVLGLAWFLLTSREQKQRQAPLVALPGMIVLGVWGIMTDTSRWGTVAVLITIVLLVTAGLRNNRRHA